MVAQGEFRGDLYYRLNVFPILLPPLRARSEDIPALVEHFVRIFSRRVGKQIDSIPLETMAAFQSNSWPGNIRELQNLVERAVILADDGVLANPFAGSSLPAVASATGPTKLRDIERAFIMRTLEEVGWVVAGPNGAAAKLGLKRTTLMQRMKKHQIERPARSGRQPEVAADEPKPSIGVRSGSERLRILGTSWHLMPTR
jgi:transcriptional regulator with GAF, ATPase, and Fis domain